jgi:anti-sigma-K factor RskA
MKKYISLVICLTLVNCSTYKPVIDTAGRSGTFNEVRAERITDDITLCTKFAEDTLSDSQEFQGWIIDNILRPASLGVVSKADDTRKNYIRKCLNNRGHSVLN